MSPILFNSLIGELATRGGGYRESGAFLLASSVSNADRSRIVAVAYYDDLDADSLTGAISFGARGYSALSDLCRDQSLVVVGDIHTHPSRHVEQSHIDAAHPMVAIPGHVALIAPHFGRGDIQPESLGVHVFHGNGTWTSDFGATTATVFRLDRVRTATKLWKAGCSFINRHIIWHREGAS